MTNVTFLTGEYPTMQGGIADYTANLARHLRPLEITPSVLISRKYNGDQHPDMGEYSVDVDGVRVYPFISQWNRHSWAEIRQFLVTHPTDILHIQYQAAAFDLGGWVNWLPWYLRWWAGRPKIVTTLHDLRIPYLFPKAGILRWWTVLALARFSDAVICTNAEDAQALRAHRWGRHVTEIPLGNNVAVNPPRNYNRQEWRENLSLPESAFVLAYFGFLNESKGGEDLIGVLDALVQRGIDARLLMVGGDVGDSDPSNVAYAQRVRTLIAERNLADRIIFTGYVDVRDVSGHLLAADAAVMPYRDGVSFRRTTLIAVLRHRLPVISTTPAILLRQIIDGENMLLAVPGDVSALAEATIRVVNDGALRERLQQGAAELGAEFEWDTVARLTARVYGVE